MNRGKDRGQRPAGHKRPRPASSHAPTAPSTRPPPRVTDRVAPPSRPLSAHNAPQAGHDDRTPPSSSLFHPFKANFNDHFETSRTALEDVLPVVSELRQLVRPSTPEKFTLYDPYYCAGSVVARWKALGISRVLHENRDFYEDIRLGTVPGPYDILVTNPPFSDDHIINMLNFLVVKQDKPWAFLAPDYIVAKPWYREFVRRHFTPAPPTGKGDIKAIKKAIPAPVTMSLPPFLLAQEAAEAASADATAGNVVRADDKHADNTSGDRQNHDTAAKGDTSASATHPPATTMLPTEPFYLVPRATYDFEHPAGAGNAHSHFKSMWYVWCGTSLRRQQDVMRGAKVALLSRQVELVHGLVALKESHLVTALQK